MCERAAKLVARGREAFDQNFELWLALERIVEVAGEAATQLSDDARAHYPSVKWQQLMAVRVRLAHAYFRIDPDIMWAIAAVDLPELAAILGPIGSDDDA